LQQSEEGGGNYRLLLQYKVPTFFVMLQGKNKLSKTKEEEGHGSCRRLLRGAALQLHSRKKKVTWSYVATQLHITKKKAMVAAVAFFMELRCSAIPQHKKEGDGNCRHLLRGAAPLQLPFFLPTMELRCNATSQ
jgi:hypothetical protein